MKVIVAGCRDFDNEQIFVEHMKTSRLARQAEVIVSGNCTGADHFGEKWAKINNIKCELYPADWKKYGRAAGPKRNKQMAQYADALIAFWDGESRGTKNMIDEADRLGLQIEVVDIYAKWRTRNND